MSMSMPAAPLEQHSLGMVSSLLDEEGEGEDRAGGALAMQSNKPEIVSNSNEFLNANDPCKSNDGADYTALTQSMFGEDAGVLVKVNHGPCIVQKDDEEEEGATANGEEGTDGAGNGGGTTEGGEGSNTPTDGTDTNNGVNSDGSTEGNVEDGGNSSPLDGDNTTTEGSDNGEDGGDGSDSTGDGTGDGTGSGSAGGSDGTEEAADLQSFYSCSPNSSSANTPPSNSKEVTLTYDYELHTSSPLNDDILSKLEDSITNDIANKYGLVTCSSIQEERRHLRASSQKQQRALQAGDVLAVGSNPEDKSLSDKCKFCTPLCLCPFYVFVHSMSLSILCLCPLLLFISHLSISIHNVSIKQ